MANDPVTSVLLLYALCMTLIQPGTMVNGKITCKAQAYDNATTITCVFDRNLKQTKTSFRIEYYQDENSNIPSSVILTCDWSGERAACGRKEISIDDQHKWDVVNFTLLGKKQGKYLCSLVNSPGADPQFCIAEWLRNSTVYSTTVPEFQNLQDDLKSKDSDTGKWNLNNLSIVLVVISPLTILVSTGIYFVKLMHIRRKWKHHKDCCDVALRAEEKI